MPVHTDTTKNKFSLNYGGDHGMTIKGNARSHGYNEEYELDNRDSIKLSKID